MPSWLMRVVLYGLMFMGTYWLLRRLRAHVASSFTGAYSQATGGDEEAAERSKA